MLLREYNLGRAPSLLDNRQASDMNGTSYEAIVVNGQIRLPEGLRLPDNSTVIVVVPAKPPMHSARIASPRLARPEQATDFQMTVEETSDAGV